MKKNRNWAFTLVELIVVITILAILATIAFISLQGYAASARDATRISDVRTIEKWLSIFSTRNSTIPLPDEPFSLTASWEVLLFQGIMGTWALAEIRQATKITDPITGEFYTYSVTPSRQQYQIFSTLEKSWYNTTWSSLWILVNEEGQSLSETFTGTVFNLLSASNYLIHLDNERTISWSGQVLLSDADFLKEAKKYDENLIFYTDLSTLTSSGAIRDFSFQGNDLKCYRNASGLPCEKMVQLNGVMDFDWTMFLRPDNLVYDKQISQFTFMAKINFDGRSGWAVLGQYPRDTPTYSFEDHALRLFPTAMAYDVWPPWGGGFKLAYSFPDKESIWVSLRRDGLNGEYLLWDQVIVAGSWSSSFETFPAAQEWAIQNFVLGAQTYTTPPYYGRWFNGQIDEVRIYNRPLTNNEIAAIVQ